MKVPQIVKILQSGTVHGLSETYILTECTSSLAWVYFNIIMGYQFVTYGENVIISVQNIIIIILFWVMSPELPKAGRLFGSIVFTLGSVALLKFGLPPGPLAALGILPMVLGNIGRVPQMWQNFSQKHTGSLSVIPLFLACGGTGVRILTALLQTPDDILTVANPLLACCTSGTLML